VLPQASARIACALTLTLNAILCEALSSVAVVRKRTILTERPPLVVRHCQRRKINCHLQLLSYRKVPLVCNCKDTSLKPAEIPTGSRCGYQHHFLASLYLFHYDPFMYITAHDEPFKVTISQNYVKGKVKFSLCLTN
jgi:hypothetical protein